MDKSEDRTTTPPEPKPPVTPPRKKDGRTLLRQGLSPYLPPPVVKAMGDLDPLLEPYVGPEASITLATSLLLSFLVLQLVRAFSGISRTGKAIADDDDSNDAVAILEQYGDTVILCGPMFAGKTRIFYMMAHRDANLPTVMSLRANAALLHSSSDKDDTEPLRILDYPGHSGLQDSLFVDMLQADPVRVALIVDATQSMATAADFLYDLLQHAKDQGFGKDSSKNKLKVFVACHKSDLSSSKNPRRIKISLRTELEKLLKVRSTEAATAESEGTTITTNQSSSAPWWKDEPVSLDLDDLQYAHLRFEATTCSVADGIDTLADFCKTGSME